MCLLHAIRNKRRIQVRHQECIVATSVVSQPLPHIRGSVESMQFRYVLSAGVVKALPPHSTKRSTDIALSSHILVFAYFNVHEADTPQRHIMWVLKTLLNIASGKQ